MWSRSRYTRKPGSLSTRLGIVLRWPIGLVLISWRYLWRITPVYRRDDEGGPDDLPPPLPDGVDRENVQGLDDGYGPLLHRRYVVRLTGSRMTPEQAVARLAADPNSAAPEDAAVFVKSSEEGGDSSSGEMEVGDEYVVRMPGPWDGPVRVVHRTPTSFRFATLSGHLEAGQIEFRARCEDGESEPEFVFEIESWARPGDRVSHLLYNKLLLAKEIQLNLWTETCLGVVRNSGGRLQGGVRVHTRRVDDPLRPTSTRSRGGRRTSAEASRVGPGDGRLRAPSGDPAPATNVRKERIRWRSATTRSSPRHPTWAHGPAGDGGVARGPARQRRGRRRLLAAGPALRARRRRAHGRRPARRRDPRRALAREVPEEVPVDVDRAGRLADPEQLGVMERTDAIEGQDVGIDGGAASAEEAAVHVVDLGTDPDVRPAGPARPTCAAYPGDMADDRPARPGPLQWFWYALGGGLAPRYRDWVLRDTTAPGWWWRQIVRALVQAAPVGVVVGLLIPGSARDPPAGGLRRHLRRADLHRRLHRRGRRAPRDEGRLPAGLREGGAGRAEGAATRGRGAALRRSGIAAGDALSARAAARDLQDLRVEVHVGRLLAGRDQGEGRVDELLQQFAVDLQHRAPVRSSGSRSR